MKKQLTVALLAVVAFGAIQTASAVREISTKANLDKVISQSNKPVVVYVYSATCPHCRRFTPKFEKVAGSMGEKFTFVKVESSKGYEIASSFGVSGVPYVTVIVDGKRVTSKSGLKSDQELRNLLNSVNN